MRFSTGVFATCLIFLVPLIGFSQSNSGRLKQLYRYVEQTDSLAVRSQKTFYLEKFLKDDYNYRETWRYSQHGGRVVYFQIDYILDSTEFTEVYYINRGQLVCSEEYEKVNYSMMEDKLRFGSILFFESAVPRHVVILGRRTQKTWRTEPGDLALTRFARRYSELKRHLPMLP